MRRRVLMAEVEGLTREDRDAVERAVSEGRAVEEERLAPVTARWAAARRERLAGLCFGILAPLVLLGWGVLYWLVEREDPEGLLMGLLEVSLGPLVIVLWWVLVLAHKWEIDRRGADA